MSKNINLHLQLISIYGILLATVQNGDVAQLARASGSYPEGRGFESPRRYQI